jgi:diguanylate cyclase (GGDEF)-like protein
MALRRALRFRNLLFLASAFVALATGAMAYTVFKLRSDAIEEAFVHTHDIAAVLGAQVSHVAEDIDEVLTDLQQRLTDADPRVMNPAAIHEVLKAGLARFPQAEIVTVVDAGGMLLATSRTPTASKTYLGDRDYYRHFANTPATGTFVSDPAANRMSGTPAVFFAKPIRIHGELAGVAVVGIPIAHFRHIYMSIGRTDRQHFFLAKSNGTILIRYPEQEFREASAPLEAQWHEVVAAGGGALRRVDEASRPLLTTVHVVQNYPLVVNVGTAEQDALAIWRQRAMFIAGGTALAVICAGLLMLALVNRVKALTASEKSLKEEREIAARHSRDLEVYKKQIDVAVGSISQGISMFDAQQRLVLCNERYREIYDLPRDKVQPGCAFEEILKFRKASGNYIYQIKNFRGDSASAFVRERKKITHTVKLPDGRIISVVAQPTQSGGWVATHEDVTERQRAQAQITYMATHDVLTGLLNRTAFDRHLRRACEGIARGECFALLYIDLDKFKQVNDTHGHPVGDELLKIVGTRIRQSIGANDFAARLGGDEFMVLQHYADRDGESARVLAHALLDWLGLPAEIGELQLTIGSSVGIALAGKHGVSPGELARNADAALYKAKAAGRGCMRFYEQEAAVQSATA